MSDSTAHSEMISVRTKWLDTEVLSAIDSEESPAKQLVILGAGYMTPVGSD